MSKKDFQTRSFIPAIHGFEEREARRPRHYSPEGEEIMALDEDGYIPTPGIKTVVDGVRVYWFAAKDLKHKRLIGKFKNINEAQDAMKSVCGLSRRHQGMYVDHWLILWTDQDGENHYQRWAGDFSEVFPYGEDYAEAANRDESYGIAYKVDPPIGSIPDAEP